MVVSLGVSEDVGATLGLLRSLVAVCANNATSYIANKVSFHLRRKASINSPSKVLLIRGEPERAPNTRGTGSGFICIYIIIYLNVCLWGDHFSEKRVEF